MTPDQAQRVRKFLQHEATQLGFSSLAVTRARLDEPTREHLREFVVAEHHGTMDWMQATLERRISPDAMWHDAKTAIILATNYGPDHDPLAVLDHKNKAAISVYAQNRDYHDLIKGRLKTLSSKFLSRLKTFHLEAEVKVFVDTAPLMEKPLAAQAGLGWQGKHTNLVSRDLGSWFFLGVILTDQELPADTPEVDHCGTCTNCLDICPTNAFPAPYKLDARKCISYLTIEHSGAIPQEFRKAMGNRIYGCDDCLAVCPWNKFATVAEEIKLRAPEDWNDPKLSELLGLDDGQFRSRFSGSPIKRIGHSQFIRNCLIAAGNSFDKSLLSEVRVLKDDPDEVVAEAAAWAEAELESVE